DAAAITAAAQRIGLRWFLLNPGDQLAWPAELAQRPVFELGGYKLYRFGEARAGGRAAGAPGPGRVRSGQRVHPEALRPYDVLLPAGRGAVLGRDLPA